MGFSVVGLGLLRMALLSLAYQDPQVWLSSVFGASTVSLFLRVGGGSFTKSADEGSGEIPEGDSRNPATITDNASGIAEMAALERGAWDNTKKNIETGDFGGKRSDAHKAVIIRDTVGDPFQGRAGPSLNILIKVVGKGAVIVGPLFFMVL